MGKGLRLVAFLLFVPFFSGFSSPYSVLTIPGEPLFSHAENIDAVYSAPPPNSVSACEGNNAVFQVFTGTAWQWQESIGGGPFANISGQVTPTLNLAGVTFAMSGNQYLCLVDGIATFPATLTVIQAPVVNSPNTETICSGSPTNIALTATAPSTYTWIIGTITGGITGASAGSAAVINQILTNPNNNTSGSVQYIVTPTSITGSCIGLPYTITVNVNPSPVVTTSNKVTICSGTTTNIALTSTVGSTFTWTVGTITGGITGASAGLGSTISQILTNPGNSLAGTVQYIVTSASITGPCTGIPYVITVTVDPSPVVTTSGSATICSGTLTSIGLTASVTSTYTWMVGTITGSITGASAGSGPVISQVLTNPDNLAAGNVDYIVTPRSTTGSCTGTPFTIKVTVNPAPLVTSPNTETICSGSPTNIALTATVPSTYTWIVGTVTGGITGAVSGSGTTISQILNNPFSTSPGTVQYLVTPTSISGGCTGSPYTIIVTVNPAPAVTTSNAITICSGTGPNITLAATVGSTYTWTVGTITGGITGASAGSGPNINQTLTNPDHTIPGTVKYIVTPASAIGSCTGNPYTITVTVNPAPVVTTSGVVTICSGTTPNIGLMASVPSTFTWNVGAVTGSITGASAGTGSIINQVLSNSSNLAAGTVDYIVTPTSITGSCIGIPFTITVTVNPAPDVTAINAATICSGISTSIILSATLPSSYTWTIGAITGAITGASSGSGTAINQVLTNSTSPAVGTVQYIVTPTSLLGSCVGSPYPVTVSVNPTPTVNNPSSANVCSGSGPNIILTSSAPSSFSWTIGTITGGITGASPGSGPTINQSLTNPSNTSSGSVQYIVTPTSTSGSCVGIPNSITVTVDPIPSMTSLGPVNTCNGTGPDFVLTATALSTFSWTIGTITGGITGASTGSGGTINQILNNPSNVTTGTVNYIVTPTSTSNSCVGIPIAIPVTVSPTPILTTPNSATICSGFSTGISLTSSDPTSTFTWTVGTITGGISGASSGSGPTINQVLTNPSNSSAGTVQYLITPTSAAGSCAIFSIIVTVNPKPGVTNPPTSTVCSGASPAIVLNASVASNFSWTVGNITGGISGASGGSGPSINQVLINPSGTSTGTVNYNITPISSAGLCVGDPYTITVTVNPAPVVTTPNPISICSRTSPNILLSASIVSAFSWTIGANMGGITGASAGSGATINQVLTNPSATNPGSVEYLVTPTSASGSCKGSTFPVVVNVDPTPAVTSPSKATTCNGTSPNINLTASTPSSFTWTIGTITGGVTGASAGSGPLISQVLNNPSNVAAGTVQYIVTPISTAGLCAGNPFPITVTVNPTPVIYNTPAVSVCSGTSSNIVLTSSTPSTYTWTVGGITGGITGASAGSGASINQVLTNPSGLLSGTVVYFVTPVSLSGLCAGVPFAITVTVLPVPILTSSLTPPDICSNSIFSYTPAGSSGATFNWSRAVVAGISNPAASGTGNPNETLINTTAVPLSVTYAYTAMVNGCTNPASFNVMVVVYPSPSLSSNLTPATICNNTLFSYVPVTGTAGTTISWNRATVPGISNASASGTGNISEVLINTTPNVLTVLYSFALSFNGCSNSQVVQVNVNPSPVLTSVLNPAAICSNNLFSYDPVSLTSGTVFSWSRPFVAGISNGASSGTGNPNEILFNTTAAPIPVTYIYSLTANGCTNPTTYSVTVFVNPAPTLSSNLTPGPICSNSAFVYTPASSNGTITGWTRAAVAGISNPASGGTADPNETLVNTTALPVNVTYVFTLTMGGCASSENVVVTVNPTPVLSGTLTPPAICSNSVFSYTPASLSGGAVFDWSRVSVAGISNSSASGVGNPNELLVNTTPATIPVTYKYQVSAFGCYSSQNVVVEVKPLPVLTSTLLPPAICSNTVFSYTPTSSTPGTIFSWSRAAVAGIANPVTSGNGNPNETLLNLTAAPVNVTYVYSLSAEGCSNPLTYNVLVTVNPAATLTSPLTTAPICSGSLFNYTATSSSPGAVLTWLRPSLPGVVQPASSGSGNISEFLTSTTNLPVVVNYIYTLFYNGCTTTQNVSVTLNPSPSLTSSLAPPAICTGSVFHYAATSLTPGTTFSWTRNAVAGIVQPTTSGAGNVNETLTNTSAAPVAVTYVYTLTASGCSNSSTYNVVVVVNPAPPLPSIAPPGPISFCSGDAVVLSAPAGYNYLWSNGEASQSITVSTSGTFSVIISDAIGCQSSPSIPVATIVLPAPAPPTSGGDITQCVDASPQTIIPVATAPPGSTMKWYDAPAGGNLVTVPSLTGLGTISFYAESSNILTGCTSLIRTMVTLSIVPHPAAPVPDPDIIECAKSPLQTLTAVAKVPVGSTIKWYTAPAGGVPVAPTLNAVGTATFYAEADNGMCSSLTRTMVTLTINPVPMAPVSLGNITECEQSPIQTLTALSSDPAAIWYVAPTGGSPVSSPDLNMVGSATYYAESLIGTCPSLTRSGPVVLTIQQIPDAPEGGGDVRVCEQSPLQVLTATATAPAGSTVKWYLTATGGVPVGSPTLNAIKSVTYYAESDNGNCSSLTRTPVTLQIDAAPKTPVPGKNITECAKDTIQTLTATATAGGSTILWYSTPTGGDPVDPVLSQVGTVSYYAEANNGSCSSVLRSAPVVLTINPTPAPPVAINLTECAQKPIQVLTAEVETPPAGVTIKWYNAATGGTSVASPILKTIGSRIYYAQATLDKCINPTRTPVTLQINSIVADPILKTKGADSLVSCESNPIVPLDAKALFSVIPGISIVCYDAATGGFEVPSTLNFAGTKILYAAAKNDTTECVSLNRIPVTLVIQAAPAAPSSSGDISECGQTPVQTLDANKSIMPVAGTSVVWYSLAKGGVVVANPTLNKANSTITYYAESVDDVTKCTSLTRTAVKLTIASTTASAASNSPLALGQTLQLKGGPELPGNTFLWTDPNGFVFNTMDVTIPNVTEAAAGMYKLFVTSLNGCTAIDSIVVVLDIARAEAQLPVCLGATLYLSGFPDKMKSYAWSGPNGYTSSEQNPYIDNVTIANSGTYTLTVTNANNATSSDTVSVSFKPLPIPIAEAVTVCPAGTMQLKAGPNGMTSYTWTSQNGSTWNQQNPPVMPFPNPPQAFKLTVVDWNGCEASKTITPTPFQPKATSNSPVCAGDTLRFRGEPNGMASYTWTGPNSFSSNLQSPSRTNVNPATDTGDYTLTVVDNDGCTYSTKVAVSFNAAVPIPTIVPNINPICEGSTLILRGGPNGMAVYNWSGPSGFVSKDQNPQIPNMSVANAGTYTLQITNSTGCKNVFETDIVVNTVNFNGTYGPYCVADPPVTISVSPAGGVFTGPGMKNDVFDPKLAGPGTHAIQYTYALAGGACTIIATKYIDVVIVPKLVTHNPILKSCSGTTADLTLPEVTTGSTPGLLLTYWQDSTATSALASPKSVAAGRYFIKGGTSTGRCFDIKPVQVLQPDSLRGAFVVFSGLSCSGDSSGIATVNITMGTAPYSYLWSTTPAQTTDSIKNLPSGTYTVVVTDAKMCTAAFTGKILEPVPIKLGFAVKSIMCLSDINGSARIDTINGSTDPAVLNSYTYLWGTTPVQTTREAFRLPAWWQKITITSANGCVEKDSVFIDVMDNIPPVITCPKDVELTVPFIKSEDGSPNKYSVKLGQPVATDNCAIDTLVNDAPAKFRKGLTYVIWTATDQLGLVDTCTQRVFIKEIPTIPQLISPNGDGLNDTFIIDGLTGEDYPGSQMLIYTRSGQLVYKSDNYELPENAWDGRYAESSFAKNNLVATGVYYYILKLGGVRSQTLKGYMYVYY